MGPAGPSGPPGPQGPSGLSIQGPPVSPPPLPYLVSVVPLGTLGEIGERQQAVWTCSCGHCHLRASSDGSFGVSIQMRKTGVKHFCFSQFSRRHLRFHRSCRAHVRHQTGSGDRLCFRVRGRCGNVVQCSLTQQITGITWNQSQHSGPLNGLEGI